jgi:hypothetical protein
MTIQLVILTKLLYQGTQCTKQADLHAESNDEGPVN